MGRRDVLVGAGCDPSDDTLVVRLGSTRFSREAMIAARLAPEVRYPEIVAHGADWIVTRRSVGRSLATAWATMTGADRERAIAQLADILAALHATATAGIADDIEGPHAVTRTEVLDVAERAALAIGNDVVLIYEVAAYIRERWAAAFAGDPDVLIHGDPRLDHVMWDGGTITSLGSLEWARRGWRECDLEILLAIGYEQATFLPISKWLAAAKPAWFANPQLADRIALMHASRTLRHLVGSPGDAIRHRHLRVLVGR